MAPAPLKPTSKQICKHPPNLNKSIQSALSYQTNQISGASSEAREHLRTVARAVHLVSPPRSFPVRETLRFVPNVGVGRPGLLRLLLRPTMVAGIGRLRRQQAHQVPQPHRYLRHLIPLNSFTDSPPLTSFFTNSPPLTSFFPNSPPLTSFFTNSPPLTSSFTNYALFSSFFTNSAPLSRFFINSTPLNSTFTNSAPLSSFFTNSTALTSFFTRSCFCELRER
jgi:hypothetical protein